MRYVLAAALSICAFAVPVATASASDSYACQFSGASGAMVPPMPGILHDPGLLDVQSSTVHASGSATCNTVDTDPGQAGNSGVYPENVVIDATFDYSLCDTGTLAGTFSLTSTSGDGPSVSGNFSAEVVAGQGDMIITGAANGERSTGSGRGTVSITPSSGGDCVSNGVAFFQWSSVFTILV